MIEINLVPAHLQKKRKGQLFLEGLNVPREMMIGIGGGALFLLLAIHLVLLMVNIGGLVQYKGLQGQWGRMSTLKKSVDSVLNESRGFQSKLATFEGLMGRYSMMWSKKINILSDTLPRGVWLKKIDFHNKTLSIEGSAISRQGEEMINVHNFTSALKKDENFLSNLKNLELGSIQTRKFEKIEIADFLITTDSNE